MNCDIILENNIIKIIFLFNDGIDCLILIRYGMFIMYSEWYKENSDDKEEER